jgi:hypothetical protein
MGLELEPIGWAHAQEGEGWRLFWYDAMPEYTYHQKLIRDETYPGFNINTTLFRNFVVNGLVYEFGNRKVVQCSFPPITTMRQLAGLEIDLDADD